MSRRTAGRLGGAILGLVLVAVPAAADEIGDALDASIAAQRTARDAQARINKLDDETRALRDKQRAAQWQALQLSAYAAQLEDEVAVEEKRRAELDAELKRVAATGTDLMPLMRRMVAELEAFVASDLPFLQEQRRTRVAELKTLLDDPGRRSAEQFRRVLEAYRTEVDYGHSLGAEETELDCGRGPGRVTLVRIGRVALYCLAGDASHAALWDRAGGRWTALDGDAREPLQQAIKVARGEGKPELLVLPVPVAEPAP